MIWKIEFIKEAEEDLKHLDHSIQIQVLKGINKVSKNPLPVSEGGYGKPLGYKLGILFSIKYIVVPSIIIYHSILENSLYFKGLCM